MALLVPTLQQFLDLRDGTTLGITKVKLLSASDTLTVPKPANTTANASVSVVRNAGEAAVTATQSAQTVTLVGTAGQTITVVTLHQFVNSGAEA